MTLSVSVIVCTHNPRRDYINKVLKNLKIQTLPLERWELLLVDNASDHLLSSEIDLSWHISSRYIREEELGLTSARIRGIKESTAETLVFVDDDNVLDSTYLEETLRISKDYPFIGAWGGQILPEFEAPPPDWLKPYEGYLGLREFNKDKWSNLLHQHETTPCGAGLCVRKVVADRYVEMLINNPQRQALDRKGKELSSCGDTDLAFTSCDIGLGTGLFKNLKLTHLIPASRFEKKYFMRLVEGITYSHTILDSIRGHQPSPLSWKQKVAEYCNYLFMNPRDKVFYLTTKKAQKMASQKIQFFHKIS